MWPVMGGVLCAVVALHDRAGTRDGVLGTALECPPMEIDGSVFFSGRRLPL